MKMATKYEEDLTHYIDAKGNFYINCFHEFPSSDQDMNRFFGRSFDRQSLKYQYNSINNSKYLIRKGFY